MAEYDYFIAGFLSTDAEYMRQLIISQAGLAPTFSSIITNSDVVNELPGFDISILFTTPLSAQAQALLDGLVSTYMTSVPVAKMKKLTGLQNTIQDYIETRYPLLTRIQFINLYSLAKFDSLPNRAAYIRPGIDWMNSISAYGISAMLAIQALTVYADIVNYVVDVTGNVGPNPNLTIAAALQINN